MTAPTVTVESVLALRPCSAYTRAKLRRLAAGRKRVRLSTVLRNDRIPLADRLWLGPRALPRALAERYAFWCADRAVSVHAVAALRKAGMHEHADKLAALPPVVDAATARAATDAAWAAADAADAARAAARYAADAWAAAWAAADAAAWAAAATAYAVAHAARCAADADREAEQRAQLAEMIRLCGVAS